MATDWQELHEAFAALATEETNRKVPLVDLLHAYCSYEEGEAYGRWVLSGDVTESLRERFNLRATQAGKLLRSPHGEFPHNYFFHNLYQHLREAKSNHLFAADDKTGIIQRIIEASATYCVVRQRLAEESEGISQRDYMYLRVREALDEPIEISPKAAPPRVATANTRSRIDAFISNILEEEHLKIPRKALWIVAGYEDPTEFERFQRDDPRTTTSARAALERVLAMNPKRFVELLDKKRVR